MGLNVIFVSPEANPFAKTGGLADVAGSLPLALQRLGCNVALILPYYNRHMEKSGIPVEDTGLQVTAPLGKREITGQILKSEIDGLPVYFIKRDEFFDRSYLYGTPEGDYFDNLERFTFFSRAVLETIRARGFEPDIIHCNDWQTGLIPAYLKNLYKNDLYFSGTATVLTIHNLAYQGLFPPALYDLTGLSPSLYNPEGVEFWGKVNLLKAGIVYADVLTTVSAAYSKEIQTPEYGCGLEGLLKKRKSDLFGILNGVDYDEWDPGKDIFLPARYSSDDLSEKAVCKKELLKEFGLKLKGDIPVIGIISRLAGQKGFDILSEAMDELMKLKLAMVILGSGDKKYQELLEGLAAKYPKKLSIKIAFSNSLAHLVEAGSDMFLMPSKYEPCGLNQIYSLRYGTIPVVRATGGLDDTVVDHALAHGNGFKFADYEPEALVAKVKEALTVYKDKQEWARLQRSAMSEDFSWENSAKKYIELYERARKKCLKFNHSSLKSIQQKP